MMRRLSEKLNRLWISVAKHHKKVKFALIGACCFLINSIVLYVLTKFNLSVVLSQIIGYEAGLVFGFYANSVWTYKHNERGSTWSSLVKYHGTSLSGLIISTIIVVMLNKQWGLHPNLALIIASAVAMIWNYFLFDRFVFTKKGSSTKLDPAHSQLIKAVLVLFIVWELVLTGLGVWASGLPTIHPTPVPPGTPYILDHTVRWDSTWYQGISDADWYKTHPQAPAFYPLFPSLLHSIRSLIGGNTVVIAFIVNMLASLAAFCYLALIVYDFTQSKRQALVALLLFAAFPTAFFMHVLYTEALFCALGFAAFYYAMRRKWLVSCIILACTTASRLPSMFFVLACFFEYLRSIRYDYRNIRPQVLYFLITPLGFVLYALYLNRLYGTPLYMFKAYHVPGSWEYEQFNLNILAPIYRTLRDVAHDVVRKPNAWFFFALWQFPSLVIWSGSMLAFVYGSLKRYITLPMALFALGSALFFVLNNNFVSVDRYLLPLFPLYIIGARVLYKRRYLLAVSLATLGSIELWFFVLFVKNYFIA